MNRAVRNFGQVFTPDNIVREMLALKKNRGRTLEPACGDGAFLRRLGADCVGVEIQRKLGGDGRIIHADFFARPRAEKFATVIGNPPYVRFQDIPPATRALLPMENFDRRTNLYLFFIDKCLDHLRAGGELIFITPRDFFKATGARKLNRRLYAEGAFTHCRETGDEKIFPGFSPACAVWRWQKGRRCRSLADGRVFRFQAGQIWFDAPGGAHEKTPTLGDVFTVKVGAVSGADRIFASLKRGCTDFVCSQTAKTGATRRMIYNRHDPALNRHKKILLQRRIRKFNDRNWWQWGRAYPRSPAPRIYVNCKTRNESPFFLHRAAAFDGSVLALFAKKPTDLGAALEKLNKADWQQLGFVCGGRFLFTQRSLENAPLDL